MCVSFLGACASRDIDINTVPIERIEFEAPNPPRLTLIPVQWHILTPDTADHKFQERINSNASPSFFSLTGEGYEKLSLNNAFTMAYIQRLLAIIDAYRNYYETTPINNKKQKE